MNYNPIPNSDRVGSWQTCHPVWERKELDANVVKRPDVVVLLNSSVWGQVGSLLSITVVESAVVTSIR